MGDLAAVDAASVSIEDVTSGINLKINSDGSLNVIATILTPDGATRVVTSVFGSVGSTAGVDTIYTITNGQTLTVQILQAGAEGDVSGTVIELFEDPNGDLSVLNRVTLIFVNGASNGRIVQQTFVGDGVRRIVMRRRTYTASTREVEARWVGYEETT